MPVIQNETELRAAVAHLRDGDTLRLASRTFTGVSDLNIRASNVTICTESGAAHPATIEQKPAAGGSRPLFIIDTPQRNIRFRNLKMRNAYCGVMLHRETLPRVSNVRLDFVEGCGFDKSLLRAQGFAVEYLYMRGVDAHDCLGTEAGIDCKVNDYCYDRAAGSRFVLAVDCKFHDNQHQQAGGLLLQESCEHWMAIACIASGNGEQPFCSKSAGMCALINSIGFANGKCALLYARDAWKIFRDRQKVVIGEIPAGEPTEYLVMGCIGIGRHSLLGDQGVVHAWPNVRVRIYQSTLVSMRLPGGAHTAAPLTVLSDEGRASHAYITNSILYRVSPGPLVNAYESTELTGYRSVRNCLWSPDGRLYRTSLKKDALADDAVESDPLLAEPTFADFAPEQDDVLHDLRPAEGSPVIRAGLPYGGPAEDWPHHAERLLDVWDEFRGFTCMAKVERIALANSIRTAHLRDMHGRARDPFAPTIGALEP